MLVRKSVVDVVVQLSNRAYSLLDFIYFLNFGVNSTGIVSANLVGQVFFIQSFLLKQNIRMFSNLNFNLVPVVSQSVRPGKKSQSLWRLRRLGYFGICSFSNSCYSELLNQDWFSYYLFSSLRRFSVGSCFFSYSRILTSLVFTVRFSKYFLYLRYCCGFVSILYGLPFVLPSNKLKFAFGIARYREYFVWLQCRFYWYYFDRLSYCVRTFFRKQFFSEFVSSPACVTSRKLFKSQRRLSFSNAFLRWFRFYRVIPIIYLRCTKRRSLHLTLTNYKGRSISYRSVGQLGYVKRHRRTLLAKTFCVRAFVRYIKQTGIGFVKVRLILPNKRLVFLLKSELRLARVRVVSVEIIRSVSHGRKHLFFKRLGRK